MLFDKTVEFYDKLYRNIPCMRKQQNPFDDLSDDPTDWAYAEQHAGLKEPVIHYVFSQRHWRPSCFGDGSFPVWYGSLSIETSIQESAYHFKVDFLEAINLPKHLVINSLRKVYSVQCQGILMDLRSKTKQCPALVQADHQAYYETQKMGLRLYQEGITGLLAKSVRDKAGANAAIFKASALSQPQACQTVQYQYDSSTKQIEIRK